MHGVGFGYWFDEINVKLFFLRWGDLSTDYLTHGIIVIFGYSQDGSYGIIFKKRVLIF